VKNFNDHEINFAFGEIKAEIPIDISTDIFEE